jgi:hypothetical protein
MDQSTKSQGMILSLIRMFVRIKGHPLVREAIFLTVGRSNSGAEKLLDTPQNKDISKRPLFAWEKSSSKRKQISLDPAG